MARRTEKVEGARVLAVANMKGGVGKTTLSLMIAEGLSALRDARVLVIDLDAQGSLSYALMGREPYEKALKKGRIVTSFFEKRAQGEPAHLSGSLVEQASLLEECKRLNLVPADPKLQFVERRVITQLAKLNFDRIFRGTPEITVANWLREEIQQLRKQYSWIIFDCPPGISIFAYAGIACSDMILMPFTPDFLAMQAITTMNELLLPEMSKDLKQIANIKRLAILNKTNASSNLPRQYRDEFLKTNSEKNWGVTLFDTQLPMRVATARAADTEESWSSLDEKWNSETCELLISELEENCRAS